jgi:Flp pilus assembly protein TadG
MLHRIPAPLRRLLQQRRGISAVEFALIAPVLIVIMFAMVEVGGAAFQYIELVQALSAGSEYAMNHAGDKTAQSDIKAAVTAALPTGWTDATVADPLYFCMSSAYSCSNPPGSSATAPNPTDQCTSSGQAIYLKVSRPNSLTILSSILSRLGLSSLVSSIGATLSACEIARFQ